MADKRPIDLDIEGLSDPVEIGVGGFATVFRAYQQAFRRTVAVKVLATLNLDDAARERFERECQAMGSLSEHPNIVTVYGAGFTTSGRPYLVMAYLPGGSLQERIDRDGPMPWQDASLVGVHLAGALETAHRAQIVHRDIKPGNVLMSTYGDAQLTDFGIARISGGHETRSGVITASMAHAPPEVLDGQRPTIAADVYSLGSTIFELMHGTPAFASAEDESMVPMLRRILTDPPLDLRPHGVPDQICQVIERAMAKKPEQRQASAVQFGRELQAARRALGLDAGKLTVPADVSVDVEQGQDITFVAAPFTGQVDISPPVPPSPAAVAALTGPVPPAYPPAAPAAPVPPAAPGYPPGYPPPSPDPYAAPPTTPGYAEQAPAAAYAPPPGAPPGYVAEPVPPAKKKTNVGLLVGIGVLVLILLGGGIAIALNASSGTQTTSSTTAAPTTTPASNTTTPSSETTESTDTTETTETTDTTDTTKVADYTAGMEVEFVDACVKGESPPAGETTTSMPANRRLLCRCVFKSIKDTIPYQRFLEIEQEVQNGTDLKDTEIQPLIQDCSNRFPDTGPASSPK